MANLSVKQQILLEEWKWARELAAQFSEQLLNLRKYGFTLATLLLTADAFLTNAEVISISPMLIFSVAVFVIVLITALFLLDQNIRENNMAVSKRASCIEKKEELKELELSKCLETSAKKWQTRWGGIPVYVIFVFVTGFIGCIQLFQYEPSVLGLPEGTEQTPVIWIIALILISLATIIFMCYRAQKIRW